MKAYDSALAKRQIPNEILDLIGIDIGSRHFDRSGQRQYYGMVGRGREDIHDRFTNLEAEVELSGRERLRAVNATRFRADC